MREVKFVNLGRQYSPLREEILKRFDEISMKGTHILSDDVVQFEKQFAEFCGTKYALGVGNGSDALFMPLKAIDVGTGDEVITVPNSFIATAWVIAHTGARIVFCDVGSDMNMDPNSLERAITSKTKAIIPVHLTGKVAAMDAIIALARNRNLKVIEDAAQAVGARYKGKRAGSFGICAGFSLHPLKNLHVHGDGGVITTNDEYLHQILSKYRNHGLRNRDVCEFWGINSRLDAIQASIASLKLNYLDKWNSRFREIAAFYSKQLEKHVQVPVVESEEEPVFHRYMIRCRERDRLQVFLAQAGIETKVNYPIPLHLQPAAASLGYKKGDFPNAERLAQSILSLPIYPELSDDEMTYVAEKVIDFCKKNGNQKIE